MADVTSLSAAGCGGDVTADVTPGDVTPGGGVLTIHPDRQYRRLAATVDLRLAAQMLSGGDGGDARPHDDIRSTLNKLNGVAETAVRHNLNAAVNNIIHSVWQRFISSTGERAAAVTCSQALMNRYIFPSLS